MTASADARPPISNLNGLRTDCALKAKMDDIGLHRQGTFKKHKVLPHPRNERAYGLDIPRSRPRNLHLEVASVLSQGSTSQASISSVSVRRTPRRIVAGPDPPPTPPAHSRTSSSSHSVLPSSPTYVASPERSSHSIREPPPLTPVTPTNQRSPPTPNLTPERSPPGKADQRPRPRPVVNDRMPSKATTDSRTESFKTAREEPETESEEDVRSTVRPIIPSARSSHSTVRQVSTEKPRPKTVGLGLGMESSPEDNVTPRTKGEFMAFDGDWGSSSEVEQEWDDNLDRSVTVRKRRPVQSNGARDEVVEDVRVTPTNATKALRSVSLALQESPVVYPARRVVSDRVKPVGPRALPTASESSISLDTRRASGISTKSTVSTVVEAILVDAPPQRRKTLRHVRKQSGLRDSALDLPLSSTSSVQSPLSLDEAPKRPAINGKRPETRVESMASTSTHNSISSRRARRAIEKSGGIPVIVIPDRRSSNKSSKEPSLRSTSSRRSKQSQSLGSAPLSQLSVSKDTPIFERPGRRSRTMSESDGSRPGDQRTLDFPPVVPPRSSSLSAPTSRNGSRTGSLTADSLKAHNALQAERARKALEGLHATRDFAVEPATPRQIKPALPLLSHGSPSDAAVQQARSFESGHQLRHVDHLGDPFFGQRLSVQKTPFSMASIDTTGTFNAEVAEAQAVSIYPHQNKSVLVVDHSNRPSESSSLEQRSRNSQQSSSLGQQSGELQPPNPAIKTTAPDSSLPVTPPQPTFKMDEVDSPLRNPRAPPEPPAPPVIAFIPATPSGLTPAHEKETMMGNYFGLVVEKPQRPVTLLKRALTGRSLAGRRFSYSGPSSPGNILSRTFSLSRHPRKPEPSYFDRIENEPMYPTPEDRPREENKLHAFWRPSYAEPEEDEDEDEDDDWVRDVDQDKEGETYRYPPVDNRPTPRRTLSLSDRVKRTFAILPSPASSSSHDAGYYYECESGGTARRTIRRTPSGNLRVVVKHRRSLDSLRAPRRPYSPPHARPAGVGLWRTYSLSRTLGRGIEKYGLHNIPRRLSERRREKRSRELRGKISGPREVRDGVGDVIKRAGVRDAFVA